MEAIAMLNTILAYLITGDDGVSKKASLKNFAISSKDFYH